MLPATAESSPGMFSSGSGMRSSMLLRNSTLDTSARFVPPCVLVMTSVTFLTAIWPPKSTTTVPFSSITAVGALERKKAARASAREMPISRTVPSVSSTKRRPASGAWSPLAGTLITMPPSFGACSESFARSKDTSTGCSSEMASEALSETGFASAPTTSSRLPDATSVPSPGAASTAAGGSERATVASTATRSKLDTAVSRSASDTVPSPFASQAGLAAPASMSSMMAEASASSTVPSPLTSPGTSTPMRAGACGSAARSPTYSSTAEESPLTSIFWEYDAMPGARTLSV